MYSVRRDCSIGVNWGGGEEVWEWDVERERVDVMLETWLMAREEDLKIRRVEECRSNPDDQFKKVALPETGLVIRDNSPIEIWTHC